MLSRPVQTFACPLHISYTDQAICQQPGVALQQRLRGWQLLCMKQHAPHSCRTQVLKIQMIVKCSASRALAKLDSFPSMHCDPMLQQHQLSASAGQ